MRFKAVELNEHLLQKRKVFENKFNELGVMIQESLINQTEFKNEARLALDLCWHWTNKCLEAEQSEL